ncbi:MAG: hypothetical protein WAO35_24470, partial [Terriglobia bacterium]
MWRRPAVSILMLIAAAILPLPARARQRMVTPGISPAQADVEAGFSPAPRLSRSRQPSQLRFSITSGAALKGAATTPGISPARADVAPGFSPAPRLSRSRQPFQLRFPNTLGAALKGAATTPGISPAKPFTQKQVVSMVRAGLGDDSGAKLIEQRGIDFAPSEDFIQTLKAAGASEAFLKALRATVA